MNNATWFILLDEVNKTSYILAYKQLISCLGLFKDLY